MFSDMQQGKSAAVPLEAEDDDLYDTVGCDGRHGSQANPLDQLDLAHAWTSLYTIVGVGKSKAGCSSSHKKISNSRLLIVSS
mmetsp:Transcript_40286/g.94673  ORF Transcript_40286/g.94673 Transcript_40286/m.94673 type:complete len:82 (+) Transcript_40286:638-883(+)